ncbi:MAG: leucyl aminopeptidase family protein [bacterium]|nr:leucyl aminopeptidase family protein [bacterium]
MKKPEGPGSDRIQSNFTGSTENTKDKKTAFPFHLEPTDLLRPFELLHIGTVTFIPRKNLIANVIFVDEDGKPYGKSAESYVALVPHAGYLPTEKNPHSFYVVNDRIPLVMIFVKRKEGRLSVRDLHALGGKVTRFFAHKHFSHATVWVDGLDIDKKLSEKEALIHFVHGLQTPTYRCDDLKSKKEDPMRLRFVAVCGFKLKEAEAQKAIEFANELTLAEHYERLWIDMPTQVNCKSTTDMVNLARKIADSDLCEITVIAGEQLNSENLNALWSVGKGRMPESPPALVSLRYMGDPSAALVALVGKCLVFDTGGEDIKPAGEFADMKSDMGGGAMALATFDLAVKRRAPVNLVVTLAIADNAVSSKSYHPGSVLRTYRGKSIEVNNTDAEGRLVLADAIEWTEDNCKPKYLVTLATLTGAIVVGLGQEYAGLFPQTEKMACAIVKASKRTWNQVWRMPLFEAKQTKVKKSHVADTGNIGERYGGATSAAQFVMSFAEKTKHAAHLDVAGVAAKGGYDATGEKADFSTGWGPALLWELVHELSKKKRKQSKIPKVVI